MSIDGVARLGAAVLTYADEGDAVARGIRDAGAHELADLVRTLDPDAGVPLTAYGSLWQNTSYRSAVEARLGRPLPVLTDVIEAVAGRVREG
jgi:N-acetylglucosamine kinase-like BadF-type ATPase